MTDTKYIIYFSKKIVQKILRDPDKFVDEITGMPSQ